MSFKLITAENGVKYLKSHRITVPHGFATRIGGVSPHEHTSSLNLAFRRGDDDKTVLENLRLFCTAVGVETESVVSRHQVHSPDVIYADEAVAGEGYMRSTDKSCDGYVTDKHGVTLGVKTADCVPILFHDPKANIIGAVHAGWRGTALGIAAECVRKMSELGARPENIIAAIGPSIHFCCYEVGEDFRDSVSELVGNDTAARFIGEHNGKLHADIVGLNRNFLLLSGIDDKNIDISELCTCCNPDLFFSHRASHGKRGTMLSVISL